MKSLLTTAALFLMSTSASAGMSCKAFLPNALLTSSVQAEPTSTEGTPIKTPQAENKSAQDHVPATQEDLSAAELLTNLDKEFAGLGPSSKLVGKHLKVLETNEKLRRKRGGFARVLTAQRTAKITRLKSALRDGNKERVWSAVDQVMMKTEMDAVWLSHYQKKVSATQKLIAETTKPLDKKHLEFELGILKEQVEIHMVQLHENYALYRAFRETFENQIANGRSETEKAFAVEIFALTGIDNPALQIELPKSVDIEPGQRPSIDFIRNEYHALDFEDGSPRHLSGLSLYYKIKLENSALRWMAFTSLFKFTVAHKIIDFLSERLRAATEKYYQSYVLKALDWITKDLQNQEAMEKHLAEIDSIASVHASRQYKTFRIAVAHAKAQNGLRSQDFSFLTSFARALEYKSSFKRLYLTTALKNVNALSLVDKVLSLERQLAIHDAALDNVIKEIKGSGDLLAVDKTLPENEAQLLKKKAEIEAEISTVEEQIKAKINEFKSMENDPSNFAVKPDLKGDLLLFAAMEKAMDRAANMGPLSYEFSPGTGLKFTSYSIVTLYAAFLALDKIGALEAFETFLQNTTGYSYSDIQSFIMSAPPAVTNMIQTIGNGGGGL